MTVSLHRCVVAAMSIIVVVWTALAASAAAHDLTPTPPSPLCVYSRPPEAVPTLEAQYSAEKFRQGELIGWDIGDSTGHLTSFRYDVYAVGSRWSGPQLIVIGLGPRSVNYTDLDVGTHKVHMTVTDCLGRTDTAIVFVEVTEK
ncbi:MAG: hypothetical protein AAFZ07_00330 [Actinomycetota bacterium]